MKVSLIVTTYNRPDALDKVLESISRLEVIPEIIIADDGSGPETKNIVDKWKKILKSNGKCEMMLPNLMYHIRQWMSKTNLDHAKAGLWGWQRGEFDDVWDIHKSGYDRELLTNLLLEKGFVNIKSLASDSSKHLHLEFYKA